MSSLPFFRTLCERIQITLHSRQDGVPKITSVKHRLQDANSEGRDEFS